MLTLAIIRLNRSEREKYRIKHWKREGERETEWERYVSPIPFKYKLILYEICEIL